MFLALIATFLTGPFVTRLAAQEYHVDLSKPNRVTFISRAPIDNFEGVTDRIDGYAFWEGDGLVEGTAFEGSEMYFEVELNGLDTGIGLRNRHMRERYFQTDKYPYATYTGVIRRVDAAEGGALAVTSSGTMAIHGKEQSITIPCTATADGSGYRIQCRFQVLLSDYDIEIPSLMFMKISETIQLDLDFFVRRVEPQP